MHVHLKHSAISVTFDLDIHTVTLTYLVFCFVLQKGPDDLENGLYIPGLVDKVNSTKSSRKTVLKMKKMINPDLCIY